ncbi:MAG: hypothetical protein Q9173_002941 [Seirophora scorigena]
MAQRAHTKPVVEEICLAPHEHFHYYIIFLASPTGFANILIRTPLTSSPSFALHISLTTFHPLSFLSTDKKTAFS